MPLVIVKLSPILRQTPPLEKETSPAVAVAATENDVPYTAVDGACVVTLID